MTCVERVIGFINEHAYIEVALNSYSYCQATRETMKLLIDNAFTIAILSGLVNLFMILGTILVTCLVLVISYFIFQGYGNWQNIEFDTMGPYLIIMIFTIIITVLFNNVFDIAAETMLHCFVYE